ncbi:JmjC domain, hydroxylase-domain-containing protein [Lipomyces japonicus]|uniref:JmjC domain, hydroxylase-domain-containing protein n=1 Tax=Lipomyces japonicus TaxID=56871 RepID=UPI0034CF15D1
MNFSESQVTESVSFKSRDAVSPQGITDDTDQLENSSQSGILNTSNDDAERTSTFQVTNLVNTIPDTRYDEVTPEQQFEKKSPNLQDLFADDELDDIEAWHDDITDVVIGEDIINESEYDLDSEDDGVEITPAYYHDGTVPVFIPTMEEFESFPIFIKKINSYGMKTGIVKVIPPQEWSDSLPDLTEKVQSVLIKHPIVQHISGSGGVFSQTNIEKNRTFTLPQWRRISEESDHQPPARRGERRRGTDSAPPTKRRRMSSVSPDEGTEQPARKSLSKFRRKNGELTAAELKEFVGFDYRFDSFEFTAERCEELERIYWKTITYNTPMYGADMLGSLFDESTKTWNVAHLDNILNDLGIELPGVNSAYLYFGMWKSTFAWHVEDQDLYSINYLHFGAPKQWYSISQADEKKFFNLMRNQFPDEHKRCREFLRHKTFNLSPTFLANHGIKVNKLLHNQGEFVITFPFGYHSGYNLGYNCAESVNFATESWLDAGARAKKCKCIPDAVDIDVEVLKIRLKEKRKETRRARS